jgi:hypothetical protein
VDVLVVGGRPAGVGAALSAARLGAKALVVEQFNCLGGVPTSGEHNRFSLLTAWGQFDERLVGGVAEEVRRRLLDAGAATYSGGALDSSVEGLKLLLDHPAGPGMSGQAWRPELGFRYQIPYRAMVAERVDNLLVAGRSISADHVALGSTRIMSTCMALGECAGDGGDDVASRAGPPSRAGHGPAARAAAQTGRCGRRGRDRGPQQVGVLPREKR